MQAELARFQSMFNQLMEQTYDYAQRINSNEIYTHVPLDTDCNFLGLRVNRITIENLMKHLILAEAHWLKYLAAKDTEINIPFPENAETIQEIKCKTELIKLFKSDVSALLVASADWDDTKLNTEVNFAGRRYTVMGFLWVIYSHHAFHLGQIDMLLRQQNIMPPEFMEWADVKGVIG